MWNESAPGAKSSASSLTLPDTRRHMARRKMGREGRGGGDAIVMG